MNETGNVETDTQEEGSNRGDLVIVGSSAGGVEALAILVSSLPADFPAPIVLAQHLDPNRPSSLDTILRRRALLPVELVNPVSRLEKGKIYVVPSNRLVIIDDGHVEVQEDQLKRRPKPSIDMLLSTAAEAYGEHLIAVILTGSGSDGAAGAVDVKNAGGTIIVQNPRTARYPSMSLALPPTVIDFEADIEQLGTLLYDLLTGVDIPHTEEKTKDALQHILELVSRQASIDFRSYKTSTMLRRIGRRMAITHNRSMRDYTDYLLTHPEEVVELVKSFLINVTQFFRDPDAFAYLKSDILPIIIAEARERDRVLRFWTAGCATGEEPYSLAMLVADMLGTDLPQWSVRIFATDLDEAAINFARRGLYSENLLTGIPEEYRELFFERTDQGYRISKTLRQMVIFGQQDLSRSAPFPRIDLVLCRNVLIYFTPELQNYVLNQFAFSLSPNGYLFLGKAETVRPNQAYYEPASKHWKVYRCRGNPVPMAHLYRLPDLNMQALDRAPRNLLRLTRSGGGMPAEQEPSSSPIEIEQLRHFNELLLRFLPTGVVVIDRSYHIILANGTARRLLGLRDPGSEQDFLHAVRGIPYTTVRNAIDSVYRERSAVTLPEVELDISVGGNGHFISLSIALMQMDSAVPDMAAISVADVTEQVQIRKQLEAIQVEQTQLMSELSAANKRLNDMNKELLDANEELQVANEELMLTHEELQATIEEFETTNEELQATNEELETNNEELQTTNEELEMTNDELRARTAELQELTNVLESERVQLYEMVELAPIYITVLRGPQLAVEAFNPHYVRPHQGRVVQGRPLEEVHELLWEGSSQLLYLAREVYQQDSARTTRRMRAQLPQAEAGAEEHYFIYTLVPSHDAQGKVSGVIIYAVDQTTQQAQEVEEEREKLRLIFDNADVAAMALYDLHTTELILGSPRYLDIVARAYRLDRDKLVGRKWSDLSLITPAEEAIKQWNRVVETGSSLRLPEVHLKFAPDERETIWYCKLTPISDRGKTDADSFMLVLAIEITEEARARAEVERLNRLKGEFLSLASHELRTPLTSILGDAQLLRRGLKQQEANGNSEVQVQGFQQGQHLVDAIIAQIRRMGRLIDEMLDITLMRNETFELKTREHVNIVELARRVVELMSAATNRLITFETNKDEIVARCDEDRMEQVLTNLISNAVKYSSAGRPVAVGIEQQAGEAIIWVRDQGIGISKEDQQIIFTRFYRTRSESSTGTKGLGLGLYIANEIVTRHGGRMWLESKQGEGSTFYISLPLIKRE
jgi:chemotaxis methyl-accepting protein methylase/signal transduction histidine kinase